MYVWWERTNWESDPSNVYLGSQVIRHKSAIELSQITIPKLGSVLTLTCCNVLQSVILEDSRTSYTMNVFVIVKLELLKHVFITINPTTNHITNFLYFHYILFALLPFISAIFYQIRVMYSLTMWPHFV